MSKISLAVWGITDKIWASLKDKIDPRKAEIVCFIDSNAEVYGGFFASRPVYDFDKMGTEGIEDLDCVLIAAYSGYRKIKEKLIKSGYSKEKVQLYITPGMMQYNLGDLSDARKELVDAIYFEPRKRWGELQKYVNSYLEYVKCDCMGENTGRWYEKGPLISHACGGVVNGKQIMYSNSKEALEYSFSKGFRLIECDVLGFEQNEVILAHDFDKLYEAKEMGYTIQSFSEMLVKIEKYPEIHMLVDVKWSSVEEYEFYISHIANCINRVSEDEKTKRQLYKQIVMEVYDEATIQSAQRAGFDVFYTQYRNDNLKDFMDTVRICTKYNVGVVGYDVCFAKEYRRSMPILKDKNIKIYAFSTDSKKEYRELKEIGVDGVFTNWLTYGDVDTL